jgi:general secretion pathway protein J
MRHKNNSCKACSAHGFTLIEILLAVALLSIVLVALYSTFFISQKAMEGADDTLVRLQEGRMAIDTLRRELDSAVYSGSNKLTLFVMKDLDIYDRKVSKLSFTAFSPYTPGLSNIEYYVEETEGRLVLLKKVNPDWNLDSNIKGTEIIEDVEGFTVECLYNGQWVRIWDAGETGKVPDELRVTITLRVKDKLIPLFEIIRPGIGKPI